MLWFYPMEAV